MAPKRNSPKRSARSKQTQESEHSLMMKNTPAVPPDIAGNQTITKWFRIAPVSSSGYSPVPQSIANSTQPAGGVADNTFRIKRIRVWAPDAPVPGSLNGYGVVLSLPGIVSTGVASSFAIGDNASFQKVGTVGAKRGCVDVIPSKEFRDKWWSTADVQSVAFTAICIPLGPVTTLFIVDLLMEVVSST